MEANVHLRVAGWVGNDRGRAYVQPDYCVIIASQIRGYAGVICSIQRLRSEYHELATRRHTRERARRRNLKTRFDNS